MPLHSSLTGTELHENKGVAAAADNTVASATSGATVWRKVNADMIDTSSVLNTNVGIFQATISDVSTAMTVYVPVPFDCTVLNVYGTQQGAVTVASSIVTVKNGSGSSMGTMTVLTSGSAGTVYGFTPTSNNTFTAGQNIQIETDGGSTGTQSFFVTLVYQYT